MRIAVFFFGLVQRSLRHVIASTRENLLGPLAGLGTVEVYFHSWKTGPLDNPRAGESGMWPDPADVARFLPEACGWFDDEAEFAKLIEWAELERVNPLRHHYHDEAAARVALRNAVFSLFSLESVFEQFLASSSPAVDCVVATRADLRFLRPLVLPSQLPERTVFIPSFHGWGGVNDRFAFGTPEAMAVYAGRRAFFDGWMLHPDHHNPEWVLMKWLQRNRIRIEPTDFMFQRVRADGAVFSLDRGMAAGP